VQLNREELLKAYRDMATIRRFEERVQEEFSKGGIPGFCPSLSGEEAAAVASCSISGPGTISPHPPRPWPQHRQRAANPVLMMQELFARRAGCAAARAARCTSPISTAACSAPMASSRRPPLVSARL